MSFGRSGEESLPETGDDPLIQRVEYRAAAWNGPRTKILGDALRWYIRKPSMRIYHRRTSWRLTMNATPPIL